MYIDKKKFNLVQLLRGIACLLVACMHLGGEFSKRLNEVFLFDIFKSGGSGVDIFFVISGFIITYSNIDDVTNYRAIRGYLVKRFVRIYPVYWIIISLFLLLQIILPSYYPTPFIFDIRNILSTYLLLPGHVMVNGVSWSLTNELFFYILFAIIIVLPRKRYIAYFAGIYTLFFIYKTFNSENIDSNGYESVIFSPMNIEFFLGVSIVFLIKKVGEIWIKPILIGGIVLFLLAMIAYNYQIIIFKNLYYRVVLFGIPAFLITLGVVKYEIHNNIKPVKRIFLLLGDASYSIYLIHLPLLAAAIKIIAILHIKHNAVLTLCAIMLLIIICSAGIIFHRKIEAPLLKKINKALL